MINHMCTYWMYIRGILYTRLYLLLIKPSFCGRNARRGLRFVDPIRCALSWCLLLMAQRLMLKQFISSFGRSFTGPVQPLPGYRILCTQTRGLLFKASAKPVLTSARTIHVSQTCRVTFNVQNKDDFLDRVVGSESPVIVDFHAQWCGPCKILGTRLEKVVAKQQGKVLMAKVDIDDHTDLALEYKVSAVPTVLAMKNGIIIDQFVGIKEEDQLEAFLKKLVGP
ncbi:thioredoxin, mitochondrial isoform X2 [Ranitomeya variabilis]|uniref:thioredoxin, mitochondrial isoform X2 n=1 Tax=Ranitomeya variabilis TaxID=490064 RepID=UPI0040577640